MNVYMKREEKTKNGLYNRGDDERRELMPAQHLQYLNTRHIIAGYVYSPNYAFYSSYMSK